MDEFWVFGYGSLMWNPGFAYAERAAAHMHGYRRALCVRSWVHRGSETEPGLVLGLDRGGSCRGIAFRVDSREQDVVLDYLRERELVTNVYKERVMPVALTNGRRVNAVTYVTDRGHRQYAGALAVPEAARIVHSARGKSGPNDTYLLNTIAHLKEMGIRDHWLEQVVTEMERIRQAAD